ncbi:M23 family metallopeptidase [Quadrisphaera sp. INWT6]|uniref:M23 family metallopeptidase n=1 Tax=Quadrisphaera sp. INWT6 TaxID=2596917 RepID=UPI0018925FA4|nr:M23 family metallopeptidase [Quadrisphaera sp. INWT6]
MAALVAPVLLTGGCLGTYLLIQPSPPPTCGPQGVGTTDTPAAAVQVAGLPTTAVAGYRGEQLANAAAVMNAARALGLDSHAQTLGVMVAMGESSLRVINRGDAAGPDSRGLFQQRANGAWGSYADRMDPTTSATNFFRALVKVPGWAQLEPTIAANRTQRNADPYHYRQYWGPAQQVVAALAGATVTLDPAAPAPVPGAPAAAAVPRSPASRPRPVPRTCRRPPARGSSPPSVRLTSPFGTRRHPVTGVVRAHKGDDIGAPCGSPIYAAAAGRVITAGTASGYGHLVVLDHGGGVLTRYGHMYADGLHVRVGDSVSPGQVIADVGSDGLSTGCHLHFEVMRDGQLVDPAPFMASQGAVLG